MEYMHEDFINVYTDGSQKQKPRRGGFGIVYVTDSGGDDWDDDDFVRPGYAGATNQQMELWAVIEALHELRDGRTLTFDPKTFRRIVIFTDSAYVINGEKSAPYWEGDGWVNRDGRPVSNSHLWELFLRARHKAPLRVEFKKVPAHSGVKYNEMADNQARASADKQVGKYLPGAAVARRKFSPQQVKQGSIRPSGQIELLHVVTENPEKADANKYKVEVVDADSPDFESVDFYYADQSLGLRPYHAYKVQLNDDPSNPRIIAVLNEVPREDIFYSDEDDEEAAAAGIPAVS